MKHHITITGAVFADPEVREIAKGRKVHDHRSQGIAPPAPKQPTMKDMTIALIQEDAKTLTEALGIAGERHDAILSALHDQIKAILDQSIRGAGKEGASVNVAESLAQLSKVCIHQNELAALCYLLGSIKADPMMMVLMASVYREMFLEKMG